MLPVKEKIHVKGRMWFEPAKCIRCGLCVYNSENGFTFKNRGWHAGRNSESKDE